MSIHQRAIATIAILLGLTSVMLGAASDHLMAGADPAVATAERYQQIYAVTILVTAVMPFGRVAGWLFIAGTLFFCGGIYAAHLLGLSALVYLVPVGGTLLMAGWVTLGINVLRASGVGTR